MSNYDKHAEAIDQVFTAYQPEPVSLVSADRYVSRVAFRDALEQAVDYETNPINRFRVQRILRNRRAFERFHKRFTERFIQDVVPIGAPIPQFDFQSILDYLIENWDDILKLLLTIIPLFI